MPLPRYGDGSAAVRVTSGLREGRQVDLVAVRVGDTVVAVATAGAGDGDADLTRTVVDRALVKLARSTAGPGRSRTDRAGRGHEEAPEHCGSAYGSPHRLDGPAARGPGGCLGFAAAPRGPTGGEPHSVLV